MVGIPYHRRWWKLAGEEDEKLRESAIETKKGGSSIAVVAQSTTHPIDAYRGGQVICLTLEDSTAFVEGTSTSDVHLLPKTGPDMYRKWKTEGS